MSRIIIGTLVSVGLGFGLATAVTAADADPLAKYKVGDKYSGYTISEPETRSMQDDDFENPGMLWVEKAQDKWSQVDGEAGKSCASCHEDVASMKGVATTYPQYEPSKKKMVALEHRINMCRTENMKAAEWKWEGDDMLGMTALVKMQSRGMPVAVKIDGEAAPFYEKGKEFYYTRRGQLDMACKHCHEDNPGNMIRAELLSQGQSNAFPLYRLKWQGLGSLHRRFTGCNKNIRAEPFGRGSEEYTNLELYVASRGMGLPIEAPGVRK